MLEEDRIWRSIGIGLACTLVFHLLLFLLSPKFAFNKFSGTHTGINIAKKNKGKSFDFQLENPPVEQPKKAPTQFVETNPDAPENIPDKTPNISNRNQQSAQPDPAKEKDPENRPSVKGQDKIKSDTAIVAGDMAKPQLGSAARPEVVKNDTQQQDHEQKLRAEQVPLSGYEKRQGLAEDGIATNVSKTDTPSTQADQAVEGAAEGREAEGGLLAITTNSKAQPRARPRLSQAMPSILTTRTSGSTNAGILGRDARWSEYGEYLNELEAIIVTEWYRLNDESRVAPPHGSHVTITFKINSKGVTDIVKLEDEGVGKQGSLCCQGAIQDRQPYRQWTEQMITVLGDEQTLTFGFYYQ